MNTPRAKTETQIKRWERPWVMHGETHQQQTGEAEGALCYTSPLGVFFLNTKKKPFPPFFLLALYGQSKRCTQLG